MCNEKLWSTLLNMEYQRGIIIFDLPFRCINYQSGVKIEISEAKTEYGTTSYVIDSIAIE